MEHIQTKNSLDSKLQIVSICSIRILNIFAVLNPFYLTRSAGLKSSGDLSGVVAALQKDEAVMSPESPILL